MGSPDERSKTNSGSGFDRSAGRSCTGGTVAAGGAWAIECGATEAEHQPQDRNHSRLRVMLDPAGHPFCLWS